MQNEFEFDKIAIAVALSLFCVVFSINFGDLLYRPQKDVDKPGYVIALPDAAISSSSSLSRELPEVLDMKAVMANADVKSGELVFKQCAVCHTSSKGGANKVGPNLWNIVHSVAAHKSNFSYSAAMLARGKGGDLWSQENLYRYLYAPKKFVPGTKMAFAGVKKDDERANLIAYLSTLSDATAALP